MDNTETLALGIRLYFKLLVLGLRFPLFCFNTFFIKNWSLAVLLVNGYEYLVRFTS